MHRDLLAALRLDPDVISRKVSFLESCADLMRDQHFRSPEMWIGTSAAATALLRAGQLAWFIDEQRARRLLVRAGREYASLGLPYGYFLLAWLEPEADVARLLSRFDLHSTLGRAAGRSGGKEPLVGLLAEPAIERPAQCAYLVYAYLFHTETAERHRDELGRVSESLYAHSTQPLGPQGRPLGDYAGLATILNNSGRFAESQTEAFRETMRNMARAYRQSIEQAQQNTAVWQAVQGPVDIIDLDAAAIATLIEQHSAERNLAGNLRNSLQDLSDVERIPLECGLSMTRD